LIKQIIIFTAVFVLMLIFVSKKLEKSSVSFKEQFITTVDEGAVDIVINDDGTSLAIIYESGGKKNVEINGIRGLWFDDIDNVIFSSDGKRSAYTAINGFKSLMIIDNKLEPEYHSIDTAFFSSDSRHIVYHACIDSNDILVVDGKAGLNYDRKFRYITEYSTGKKVDSNVVIEFQFSPDNNRYAYKAFRKGKWFVVTDGQEDLGFDKIGHKMPLFSPGSKKLIYTALRDNSWYVIVNGETSPAYDSVRNLGFVPVSNYVAYTACKDDKCFMVIDDKNDTEYGSLTNFIFSPDGKRLAKKVSFNGKDQILVDGIAGPQYDTIRNITFGSDSKHYHYEASNDGNEYIVIDGQPILLYEAFSSFGEGTSVYVSDDGKTYIHVNEIMTDVTSSGRMFHRADLYINNNLENSCEIENRCRYHNFLFSSDNKHLAYIAAEWEHYVVIDSIDGPKYGYIYSLFSSPDGKRFAYVAKKSMEDKYIVVVDEEPSQEYYILGFDKYSDYPQIFTHDSKRYFYTAVIDSNWVAVIDGKAEKEFQKSYKAPPIFSPNCRQYAYVAYNDSGSFMVRNGIASSRIYQGIYRNALFSHDSKHLVYFAKIKEFKYCIVVNDQQGPVFDDLFLRNNKIKEDGTLVFLARRGTDFYKITCKLN
jgi:hypothetical protein